MKTYSLDSMKDGWFIGDFTPSVYRTSQFEVACKFHSGGEWWPEHYQKEAVEINLLVKGKMWINDTLLEAGDIFVIEPMEKAKPTFSTDCHVVCVKIPSIPGDKVTLE